MGSGSRVQGLGLGIQGSRTSGFRFQVSGLGFRMEPRAQAAIVRTSGF